MTRPLLVLRPEPGNARTCAAARAMGLEALAVPLFVVEPVEWAERAGAMPPYSALVLTSANAVRHAGPKLQSHLSVPVLAVGEQTAAAAQAAGFVVMETGTSGVEQLLKGRSGRFLHWSGEHSTDAATIPGADIDRCVVYTSREVPCPDFGDGLARDPIALLHSTRAARHFAALVPDKASVSIIAISHKVAIAAGPGWESVAIAANPRDEDMLAEAGRLGR